MRGQLVLVLAAPVLVLALAMAFCGSPRPPEPEKKAAAQAPGGPAKILQFYPSVPAVARGEQALLCYSVENARAVRISPPVDGVWPAYSRCVPVRPGRTTRYTLTAEGPDGRTVAASVTLEVKGTTAAAPARAAVPEAGPGPAIVSLREERKQGPGGGLTLLCYETEGADTVQIEPGVLSRGAALRGCLGVEPKQPTLYVLTAFGRDGRTARRSITVGPE